VELVTGDRLRVFGCPAYAHIDASLRKKFGDNAWKGIFIGYVFDSPAWLIYKPVTRRVIRSRNVVFDETWRDTIPSPQGPPLLEDDDYDDNYEIVPNPIPQTHGAEIIDTIEEDPDEAVAPTRTLQLELERVARIAMAPRSRSERAQVAKAFDLNLEDDFASEVILLVVFEPSSYNQAMKSPERPL
jgi:hypothetical protein